MTIVDDKGRLFKWINLFDFLLLFIIVIIGTWGTIKIVKHYTNKQATEYYAMDIRAINLDEVIVSSLKKGDMFNHANGSAFGIIVSEPSAKPTQVYVTTPQGTLVARTQPKLKDVDFTMIVQVPAGSKEIKYGNQTFKTGATGFLETFQAKYTILVCGIRPFTANESNPNPFLVNKKAPAPTPEQKTEPTKTEEKKQNP